MAEKAAGRPFSVMIKPVGSSCNLRCDYCYYSTPDGPAARADAWRVARMSFDILETFTRQYIEASPDDIVYFTWHGGEPALAGLDFYREAVALQKAYATGGRRCVNNLQTNGVLLDGEWCDFLAEERFVVGLSIDGDRDAHDFHRKDRAGRGTYALAAGAVKRLQARGVQPDLLCTVTARTAEAPLDVYGALRELHPQWVQFIPVVRRAGGAAQPDGVTPDSVSPDGYGNFLCAVFDEWLRNDVGKLDVQLFAETAGVLSGGAAGLCCMAPVCGRALIAESDGGVYSCDHFVEPAHRIGAIGGAHLGALADLPEQRRFGEAKRDGLPGRCRACRWLALCNGGCPKDRIYTGAERGPAGYEPGLNYLCAGLERFFAHSERPLKRIVELSKAGRAPREIAQTLQAESAAV